MTSDLETIARIADGLTEAMREGLLRLEPARHYPYSALSGVTRARLFAPGLLHFVALDTMEITPLGIAVRDHIARAKL